MKPKHLLALAAVVAVLIVLRLLLVGPEERIRREMVSIGRQASKTGAEKPIVAAATARSLSGRFAAEAEALDLRRGEGVKGRDAIARAIGWARESWSEGELFFEPLEVEMTGEESAEVQATVRILDPGGAPASDHDGTRVRLSWAKEGGSWLIVRAEAETPQ